MKQGLLFYAILLAAFAGCLDGTNPGKTVSVHIPEPYYVKSDWPVEHTIDELWRMTGIGFARQSQDATFGSSEMAAYLEWMLEKYGFDTKICRSDNFRQAGIAHAWVAVDLPRGRYFVEPTARNVKDWAFTVIRPYDVTYPDYKRYESIYNDIYEAGRNESLDRFDWWNEDGFREKPGGEAARS